MMQEEHNTSKSTTHWVSHQADAPGKTAKTKTTGLFKQNILSILGKKLYHISNIKIKEPQLVQGPGWLLCNIKASTFNSSGCLVKRCRVKGANEKQLGVSENHWDLIDHWQTADKSQMQIFNSMQLSDLEIALKFPAIVWLL